MKKCEEFAPLLSAFVDGELTEEERAEVLAHVSECEKCRRLLGELTALHAALGEPARLAQCEQARQFDYQISAVFKRHFGARPFVKYCRFTALSERARHYDDNRVCVCKSARSRNVVRVAVVEWIVFGDYARGAHTFPPMFYDNILL